MTLTTEDLSILKRAFLRQDHEFITGFVYLSEAAICNRIEEIDPGWTFEVQRLAREGTQVVTCARLTIKGVSREGIGMAVVLDNARAEPEKSSVTDALKRCARLFGVGRYLLDAPKEGAAFDKWLAEQQKQTKVAGEIRPTPPTTTPPMSPIEDTGDGFRERVEVGTDIGKNLDEIFPSTANSIVASEVEVKLDKKQKPYLTFSADGLDVTTWTRDPLRGILSDEVVEALTKPGTHKFSAPIRLIYKNSEDGKYHNLYRAEVVA